MAASIPKRVGRLLLACVLITTPLTGCSTIHRIPMDPGIPEAETKAAREAGQRITGYTTTDGTHHRLDGWVRLAGSDSLLFRPDPSRSSMSYSPDSPATAADTLRTAFTLARAGVASVDARQGSPGKTTLLVLSILAGAFGILAAVVAIGGGMDLGY